MRSPTILFNDAWQYTKEHFALFVGIYALPVVTTIAYEFYVQTYLPLDRYGAVMFDQLTGSMMFVTALLAIVLMIISFLGTFALLRAIVEPTGTTMQSAYRYALTHFLPFLWLAVLVGLATMLGFILLVIPGIIVWVWLVFAQFIFVKEEKRGIDAMRASREHVRGHWWQVLGRLVAILLLTLLVFMFLGFAFSLVMGSSELLIGVVANVASIIYIPFFLVYVYFMYSDLKIKKEGSDAEVTITAT